MNSPNCYDCKYKGNVPGSCHSTCNKLGEPIIIFATITLTNKNPLNIQAKEAGVRNGWFNWPLDFDPVWLINCDGFEKKRINKDEI